MRAPDDVCFEDRWLPQSDRQSLMSSLAPWLEREGVRGDVDRAPVVKDMSLVQFQVAPDVSG
eukprot:9176784-Lingulodinium_polyedra.AAC.1